MQGKTTRLPGAGGLAARLRRYRVLIALLVVVALVAVVPLLNSRDRVGASASVSQVYYTPLEAQQLIATLRTISGDPSCCTGPVSSTISMTSGADGNTVYYDHYEDGYEPDPTNPVQGSSLTLSLDAGDLWTQSSDIPVDQPGRGAGNYYDGRDRIVSTAPLAMTQAVYSDTPGVVLAGAVQVLDVDKSGTRFDIPVGEDADYNQIFEYTGGFRWWLQRGVY